MLKPIISADSHVSEPPKCYIDNSTRPFATARRVSCTIRSAATCFRSKAASSLSQCRWFQPRAKSRKSCRPRARCSKSCTVAAGILKRGWPIRIATESPPRLFTPLSAWNCAISRIWISSRPRWKAYNRWLAEFCAPYPQRLIGLGQCAVKTPASGIRELDSIKALGFKGVMLPGLPGTEEDYNHESYTEFFDALVDLELVPSFHILTSGEGLYQGFRGTKINSFMSIVRGNQDLMSMFVFDGIFMRHPKLKIVSAEADGGWIPHYMYRMDHAYDRHRHWMKGTRVGTTAQRILPRPHLLHLPGRLHRLSVQGRAKPRTHAMGK